ncbi:MAG TPA: hypothetical protein VFG76_00635 [Candidatus Polarisedimenticolia bacterium]|nr:hypothetical protein [Candidatus Polarisedimenticolia bacterium]
MKRFATLSLIVIGSLALVAPRWSQDKPGPGRARITIYRIVPGRQLDFLKWMAAQDEVAKEGGVAAVQLYTHINGDDWDFVGIAPVTTPEQDKMLDEIAAKRGLKTGLPASLEFRDLVASHTDTFAAGPMSAADLIAQASK